MEKYHNTDEHISELGDTLLHQAAEKGDVEEARALLEQGVDINARNEYRQTPLHLAVINKQREVFELLLEKGAEVNTRNLDGNTPLHAAVTRDHALSEALIDAGANVRTPDEFGFKPLHLALLANKFETADLLLERGASIEHDFTWTTWSNTEYNESSLHQFTDNNNLKAIEFLVDKGVDVNTRNKHGYTPLHWAAWKGNIETANVLLAKGADINIQANDNHTPLHRAAANGQVEMVKLLLDRGANALMKDHEARKPVDLAIQRKELNITKEQERYGQTISILKEKEMELKPQQAITANEQVKPKKWGFWR
jgi:ankyrin repeat protein